MKISVIVPYWNSEEWIGNCCDSLTNQKGDFEFILVDDHSTDRGKDIVMQYAHNDDRFMVLDNLHTKGVSGARNTGLDYATGDWVTFLDADDELTDNAYALYSKVGNGTMYQFNHYRHYRTGKTVLKYTNPSGVYDVNDLPQMWFGVWNKLYKAKFIKGVRFDEDITYGEDGLFILECLARGVFIRHLDDAVVIHNFINDNSLSKSKTAEELIKQTHAYEAFLLRQSDPDIRTAVCYELSRLWTTPSWLKVLGGK